MLESGVLLGDCLERLREIPSGSCDLIYLDPPFFTGRVHTSMTRDGARQFAFNDVWSHSEEYLTFITERLVECRRVLKDTGSIFFHSDHNNVYLGRHALDEVFGPACFQSEIIWHYKRWSNARRGLLQQHQTILFYSKTADFKWNTMYGAYSPTTNVDQIMQKRARDERGKSVYAKADDEIVFVQEKKGVPLGDVWEIPFLNPKAKERVGYPTQKPLLLLERIVELTTDERDVVLDPFCGSGTTLVAAHLRNRRFIGIDISAEAVALCKERLANPVRTESHLLRKGMEAFENNDPWVMAHLTGLSYSRVQRNGGIDALLKSKAAGKPCFVRVQRQGETLSKAVFSIKRATAGKGACTCVVVATGAELFQTHDPDVKIIPSPAVQIEQCLQNAFEDEPQSRECQA